MRLWDRVNLNTFAFLPFDSGQNARAVAVCGALADFARSTPSEAPDFELLARATEQRKALL